MKKFFIIMVMLLFAANTVSATEIEYTAPEIPDAGREFLQEEPESLQSGLLMILENALPLVYPAFTEAAAICARAVGIVILLEMVNQFAYNCKNTVRLIGTISLAISFLSPAKSLIPLGETTVHNLTAYGRLLLPVMTGAMAAQGQAVTSGALYMGTAFFDAVLSTAIERLLVPAIYIYLTLSIATYALDENAIGKMKDSVKGAMVFILKTILYTFTGYMTVSGAVSGSTDALAMKAAKITISGMVPVVGGVLSDASEAVLVSTSIMKNAAGVYGILAILAMVVGPFIRLGMQYLIMKLAAFISGSIGQKELSNLILDFSTAMGLTLSMTAAVSFMLLISTVCFMKVVI